MKKNISVQDLENGNTGKKSESFMKEIQSFILFNWIIGYFPFSYSKQLTSIKFSWISWTTFTSVLRMIFLISVYVVGYKSYYNQHLSKNISTSSVHKIIMAHEFVSTSMSDFLIFTCFPKFAANLTTLMHIFGLKGERRNYAWKKLKYYSYTILISLLFVCGVIPDILVAKDFQEVALLCALLCSGSLRNVYFIFPFFVFTDCVLKRILTLFKPFIR